MKGIRKFWQTPVLASVLCALIGTGHAQAPDGTIGPAGASPDSGSSTRGTTGRSGSAHDVRAAVRLINQAALQRDFASNERIHALLQDAQGILAATDARVCCGSRIRLIDFERDLDHAVNRADDAMGAGPGQGAARSGQPGRDELNLLAREGQALLREPAYAPWTGPQPSPEAMAAARRPDVPVEAYAAAGADHDWPSAAIRPQAMTLLSLNF